MNFNISDLKTNETLDQVSKFFDINITNLVNESVVTKTQLFDLYEAYLTKEREQLVIYRYLSYIVGTLIVLSNITVVVSSGLILKKGQQQKSTYLLLGNVSLADTIVGISLLLGTIVDQDINTSPMCIFQMSMLVCPAMVSIFSVGMIAIDRYIYILHGLYYQRWFTTTKVRIGIACIWMIGIFIATLPAMGWTGRTFTDYRCWYIAVFPSALLIVLSVIVLSTIIFVCVLYILILHSAVTTVDKIRGLKENKISYINKAYDDEMRKVHQVSQTTVTITVSTETVREHAGTTIEIDDMTKTISEKRRVSKIRQNISKISHFYSKAKDVNSHPSKLKAVRTVLLVTLCFVGTWAPYYVAIIVYVKCDILRHGYDCVPLEILTLGPLYLLGVTNCLFDPLIYAWRHSGFKRTLRKMYWKYIFKLKIQS